MASAEQPTDNGTLKPPESEVNASTTANATTAETAVTAADSDTVVKSPGTEEFPQHSESPAADAAETAGVKTETTPADKKWPGWPGDCVFRLVVPVLKVGSIIGRKGDLIKKMCEETRARIRVLDGPVGSPDRIVLISGKEEPEAPLSPAMDAVVRVFKRVSGLPEGEVSGAAAVAFCSIRLLVASSQAINLIGKQGSSIKLIQESSGASVRVLSNEEVQIFANSDERIVELQGEAVKVLKALEAVVGHLRKFLVDHSVLPLFEKSYNTTASQDRQVDTWADKTLFHSGSARLQAGVSSDYPLSVKRDSLFLDRETTLESQLTSPGLLMYGQDSGLSGLRSSGLGRSGGPIVTQVAQTMQIPLTYAEDIIGMRGANIQYIRQTSGAILSVQESRGLPDEITVEIKGTAAQVQTAQQLIQECINGPKEVVPGGYGKLDSSLRSSYSQLGSTSYSPSSFSRQSYGGYEPSGVGRYSSFRL